MTPGEEGQCSTSSFDSLGLCQTSPAAASAAVPSLPVLEATNASVPDVEFSALDCAIVVILTWLLAGGFFLLMEFLRVYYGP